MKNSTLLTIAVLVAVAMLSATVVVLPIQEATAQDTNFTFKQRQSTDVVALLAVAIQPQ
jgi:hypothetical protein